MPATVMTAIAVMIMPTAAIRSVVDRRARRIVIPVAGTVLPVARVTAPVGVVVAPAAVVAMPVLVRRPARLAVAAHAGIPPEVQPDAGIVVVIRGAVVPVVIVVDDDRAARRNGRVRVIGAKRGSTA